MPAVMAHSGIDTAGPIRGFPSPSFNGFGFVVVITQAYNNTGSLVGITVFLSIARRKLTAMLASNLDFLTGVCRSAFE